MFITSSKYEKQIKPKTTTLKKYNIEWIIEADNNFIIENKNKLHKVSKKGFIETLFKNRQIRKTK